MAKVRYSTECRDCGSTVSALLPAWEAENDSSGKRVRCGTCEATNFVENHETDGPIA